MKGGAIYFSAEPFDDKVYGQVVVSSTRFEGNTAAVDAGAVYINGCTDTEPCHASAGFGDGSNYFNNNYISSTIPGLGAWSSNEPGSAEMLYSRGPMNFTACPSGTYTTDASVANSDKEFFGCPFLCPAGRYELSRTTELTTCSNACPAGAYCPSGSGEPISCPAGKYSETLSQTSPVNCMACPHGYITPVTTSQAYWDNNPLVPLLTKCELCPAGTYATTQQSFCLLLHLVTTRVRTHSRKYLEMQIIQDKRDAPLASTPTPQIAHTAWIARQENIQRQKALSLV